MGSRIKQIDSAVSRYTVISETDSQQFDSVILAVGPHQLEGLMTGISAPKLSFEPIVTVYFKFDRRVRLGEEMSGQRHGLAQWFFDRRALNFPNHNDDTICAASEGLIAAVISASGPHESLPQEVLADCIQAELAHHIPDCPKPVWRKVITEKYATFACTPAIRRLPSITSYPGVFLAGDHIECDYPATLEGAVRNGIRAATESINYLRHSPTEYIR
jgi:protoporphyrinogen oxidase